MRVRVLSPSLCTRYPKAYWYLLFGTLINGTATFVLPFESIYLVSSRHLLVSQASAIVAVYGIGSCVSALFGGMLADRIGRRPTIISGLVCLSATTFGLAFAQDIWLITLLTFSMGFWISWYRPASNAVLADLLPQADQAQANGLLYWAYNVGMAISPLLASVIVQSIGYSVLFCADGIGTVLFCLLISVGLPETRPAVTRAASHQPKHTSRKHSVLRDGRFLLFTGLSFLLTSMYFQYLSTLPADMQLHGLDASHYAVAISVNGIMVVLIGLPLSNLLTRYAPFRALAVSALLLGLGFGLTALADDLVSLPMYAGSILVWTIGEIVFVPVSATIVAMLSPASRRGLYQGVARTSWGLSAFAGPLLGGVVLLKWGAFLWIGCAVLGSVLACSFFLLGRMKIAPPSNEETSPPSPEETADSPMAQRSFSDDQPTLHEAEEQQWGCFPENESERESLRNLEPHEERETFLETIALDERPTLPPSLAILPNAVLSPEMEAYLTNCFERVIVDIEQEKSPERSEETGKSRSPSG